MMFPILVSMAFGSQVGESANPPVSTPFGDMPHRRAELLCEAKEVLIGKVVHSTSFEKKVGPSAWRTFSELKVKVQRPVRGVNSTYVYVTVPGGMLNGKLTEGPSHYPRPYTGLRYMMAYSRTNGPSPLWPSGTPIFATTAWIHNSVSLPSNNYLKNQLNGFCNDL